MTKQSIIILPTKSCRFRCEHCGVKKDENEEYISLKKVEKLLWLAGKQNFRHLTLTGGEPSFDYEKMIEIIKIAKKNKIDEILLVTNGSFLLKGKEEERLKELRDLDVHIAFSIDKFHLKFISYEFLLKILKIALNLNLNVSFMITQTKENKKEAIDLGKRIANDLNGRCIKLYPFPSYDGEVYYSILLENHHQKSSFRIKNFKKTGVTNKGIPHETRKLKRLVFRRCISRLPTVDPYGNIIPCAEFTSINNPELYAFNNIDNLQENRSIDEYPPFLKKIVYDRFPFLNLYLKARKDKELKKILESREYQDHCDLCYIFMKNKEKIEKLPEVSKTEIILFSIRNFHYLVLSWLELIYFYFARIVFHSKSYQKLIAKFT